MNALAAKAQNDDKNAFSLLPLDGKTLNEAERSIYGKPIEYAYAFNQKGIQIYRAIGTHRQAGFKLNDRSVLKNLVITHNHPPNENWINKDNFSISDIVTTIKDNYAEMRLVTSNNKQIISFKRKGDFWVNSLDDFLDMVDDIYENDFKGQFGSDEDEIAIYLLMKLGHQYTVIDYEE